MVYFGRGLNAAIRAGEARALDQRSAAGRAPIRLCFRRQHGTALHTNPLHVSRLAEGLADRAFLWSAFHRFTATLVQCILRSVWPRSI